MKGQGGAYGTKGLVKGLKTKEMKMSWVVRSQESRIFANGFHPDASEAIRVSSNFFLCMYVCDDLCASSLPDCL